jgi:UDPglucose 6-dehydrogenase
VARAMGKDGRIGAKFLHAGPGFGGSCFPKDTNALACMGRECGSPLPLVEQAIKSNERQKALMVEKISSGLSGVKGRTHAVLGLAFKPNTDDIREAPALYIIRALIQSGAVLRVYDPAAMKEAEAAFADIRDRIVFCADEYEAIRGAEALVIVTEWNQFRNLDLKRVKGLIKNPVVFDLRNIYGREAVEREGFVYHGVGA